MYIYYVLRRTHDGATSEVDGEVNAEQLPGVDLDNGPDIITALVQQLAANGQAQQWDECDLTDAFFDREDTYIHFHDRWIRRSDAPWRKDRNN